MPTFLAAYTRHVNCYLFLAERAAELYVKESTQAKGIAIFDHNRGQIEAALDWVGHQDETRNRDLVLAAFIDALSATGMLRYSIRDKLIPLLEQRISAAERLGLRDMEADAYDDLGIKYAYLGHLRQAIEVFEMAAGIASEVSDKELLSDIEKHVDLARRQLDGHSQSRPPPKIYGLPHMALLQLQRWIAVFSKNPFMEVTALNKLASKYLEWGSLNTATRLFQRAVVLSKEIFFRLGELEASMGLLHVELLTGAQSFTSLPLAENGEFEWSNDLLVLETLLELGPVIQQVEAVANILDRKGDLRADQVYGGLDEILGEMDKLLLAVREMSEKKDEKLLSGMKAIRAILKNTVKLYSVEDEGIIMQV